MDKSQKTREEQFETHSDEMQDILGYVPHWIVRWGIAVFFCIVLLFLLGSWFFKYPDIITSSIVVTTQVPPVSIVARTSGRIQILFVHDGEEVRKSEPLSMIENTAQYEHVALLKKQMEVFRPAMMDLARRPALFPDFDQGLSLGEVQSIYQAFLRSLLDYESFVRLDYDHKKITAFAEQIRKQTNLLEQTKLQVSILEKELGLAKNQYDNLIILFDKKIISQRDLDDAKALYLQKEYAKESVKSGLINIGLQIAQLQQSIREIELSHEEQSGRFKHELKKSFENLASQVSQWEQEYMLLSPIDGVVTFTKYWSPNQSIKVGDIVMTVVPSSAGALVGKVLLPVHGSGKVRTGQNVNIRLDNYPYQQYGMARGIVRSKSLVPDGSSYTVEVELPDGLVTNYGKALEFTQEMSGSAEIITEDIRLLIRFVSPLKFVLEKHHRS